jgi:hypothetical protein
MEADVVVPIPQPSEPAAPRAASSGEAQFATAFFAALLDRYPLLARSMSTLADEGSNIGLGQNRNVDEVMDDLLGVIAAVLLALEFARLEQRSERVDVVDFCRLYEACVYTVSTVTFEHQHHWPSLLAAELAHANRRADVRSAGERAEKDIVEYCREYCQAVDPTGARDERRSSLIDEYLRGPGQKTRLHLDLELFLYSVALLGMRSLGDPQVAEYALSPDHRFSFIGNPIAAFFKATGLIATPYTPLTQLRLGYELCNSALARFPDQAGAHHTSAIYQLKLGNAVPGRDGGHRWLEGALDSAHRAIALDPEWPEFHATRGSVRRRLGDFELARLDYETAIELVVRCPDKYRRNLSEWIQRWTAALDQVADQQFAGAGDE